MSNENIIDIIFNDPSVKYELTEFDGLGKPISEMLNIYSRPGVGKQTGKKVYYIKPLCKFHSEKEEFQIYVEGGKSNPEEIVRQLWVWKLINYYGYSPEQIRCEIPVYFGSAEPTKFADIAVYRKTDLETVKILFEVKKPKRKDGIEQLKSYLGANGNPIGVWSNGADKLILYKADGKDFNDTLSEIPKVNEEIKDVIAVKRTLTDLKKEFNFKKIIQDLEELVLADSGNDEFNEIFKLIYAKIYDEKQAEEDPRRKQEVLFKKYKNPKETKKRINELYQKACENWPGVFKEANIELNDEHLQVCIGPIEDKRLLGSNLRIMDDAFEYLIPTEAKKKKGQFFTPRHVIDMCVRMLNPKEYEYVIDPSCGSAGFLLHAMEWAMPADSDSEREKRRNRYAQKYLWGIDFEERAAKTSRALMLIAGDGHTNIFGPNVSSIDPKTWYKTRSGKGLMVQLCNANLLKNKGFDDDLLDDEEKAWDFFSELNFDIVLANPPFAGELKDKKMLQHYELAAPALRRAKDKQPKEERDVIFIERIINLLKPGGRAAIVLPQGKFNNSSLAYIREFILHKARLLAVVGLHGNTFKPHTGTKTSVLVIQKYTREQLAEIDEVKREISSNCPDYEMQIRALINNAKDSFDIDECNIPDEILTILNEEFPEPEDENTGNENFDDVEEQDTFIPLEERIEQAVEQIADFKRQKTNAETRLQTLSNKEKELFVKFEKELDALTSDTKKDKKQIALQKKDLRSKYNDEKNELRNKNKAAEKIIKDELKMLNKQIPLAEENLLRLTVKGRLQILLNTPEAIQRLRDRYIDTAVAQRLDYPIFMAVSERGGKNNSGDYEYKHDDKGNFIEDERHNPMIDQDLVNLKISRDKLKECAAKYHKILHKRMRSYSHSETYLMAAEKNSVYNSAFISDDNLCIAEAFVKFAVEQGLDFWVED